MLSRFWHSLPKFFVLFFPTWNAASYGLFYSIPTELPILWQIVQFDALCAFFDDAVWREFGSLQLVVLASAGAVFSCFLITSLYLYIFVAIIIR